MPISSCIYNSGVCLFVCSILLNVYIYIYIHTSIIKNHVSDVSPLMGQNSKQLSHSTQHTQQNLLLMTSYIRIYTLSKFSAGAVTGRGKSLAKLVVTFEALFKHVATQARH